MFSMSLKSVPGCLVSIAPTRIGVPVAAWPGLVPHDEMAAEPLEDVLLALVVLLEAVLLPLPDDVLLGLFELLPQAAITNAPITAAEAAPSRTPPGA
jgi:hypothetical protein